MDCFGDINNSNPRWPQLLPGTCKCPGQITFFDFVNDLAIILAPAIIVIFTYLAYYGIANLAAIKKK
jgi:hypothetical protein